MRSLALLLLALGSYVLLHRWPAIADAYANYLAEKKSNRSQIKAPKPLLSPGYVADDGPGLAASLPARHKRPAAEVASAAAVRPVSPPAKMQRSTVPSASAMLSMLERPVQARAPSPPAASKQTGVGNNIASADTAHKEKDVQVRVYVLKNCIEQLRGSLVDLKDILSEEEIDAMKKQLFEAQTSMRCLAESVFVLRQSNA